MQSHKYCSLSFDYWHIYLHTSVNLYVAWLRIYRYCSLHNAFINYDNIFHYNHFVYKNKDQIKLITTKKSVACDLHKSQ